jgi:hypothetical protein
MFDAQEEICLELQSYSPHLRRIHAHDAGTCVITIVPFVTDATHRVSELLEAL